MAERRMRIIAVANQKGGVGKTTTTINLAAALVEAGKRVLIVDVDPQGNASTGLGVESRDRARSTFDLIAADEPLAAVVRKTAIDGLLIVPATTDLSSADIELLERRRRSYLLSDALRTGEAERLQIDFVLLDCPPSLNVLTVNALVAADSVLIPLQSEFYALEGLSQLMQTVRQVRETANPGLRVEGIVLTMHDSRNRLAQQVEADVRATLAGLVFDTVVPRNVRISEAPSFGAPVTQYDPASKGALAYRALAAEILARAP
jgi:chromosome partitioning protein